MAKKGAKYRPRFAKELAAGMCKDGKSEVECCQIWGVSRQAFYEWKDNYPKFKHASELAEADRATWWHKLNRDVACGEVKGNAGTIIFALKNIEGIQWKEKVEVAQQKEDRVHMIQIECLPTRRQMQLEHIIEGEVIESSTDS